jgi:hypothetical protein
VLDQYVLSLARDYLFYVDAMVSGEYSSDELRELSAQRSLCHNELIRLLGDEYQRPFDMKAYCRTLVENS